MLKILSYLGTFMAGGIITLVFHCMLIVAKEDDERTNEILEKHNKS